MARISERGPNPGLLPIQDGINLVGNFSLVKGALLAGCRSVRPKLEVVTSIGDTYYLCSMLNLFLSCATDHDYEPSGLNKNRENDLVKRNNKETVEKQ